MFGEDKFSWAETNQPGLGRRSSLSAAAHFALCALAAAEPNNFSRSDRTSSFTPLVLCHCCT